MKKGIYYLIIFLCISGFVGINLLYYYGKFSYSSIRAERVGVKEYVINDIKVEPEDRNYNKVMFVAHPDDETIFGGAHLIEDDYVVVCITCGVKKNRLEEYKTVMNFSNDKYIYLGHTDLEPGAIISDWTNEKEQINEEIKKIINSRNWEMVVTHNPEGEYGHKHHKMIDQMVTDNVLNKDKLYYFGKFYKKGTLNDAPTLDDKLYQKKREMLALYVSQPACTDKSTLTYMFNHENWVKYEDWK